MGVHTMKSRSVFIIIINLGLGSLVTGCEEHRYGDQVCDEVNDKPECMWDEGDCDIPNHQEFFQMRTKPNEDRDGIDCLNYPYMCDNIYRDRNFPLELVDNQNRFFSPNGLNLKRKHQNKDEKPKISFDYCIQNPDICAKLFKDRNFGSMQLVNNQNRWNKFGFRQKIQSRKDAAAPCLKNSAGICDHFLNTL